jgi:hypothetical protein
VVHTLHAIANPLPSLLDFMAASKRAAVAFDAAWAAATAEALRQAGKHRGWRKVLAETEGEWRSCCCGEPAPERHPASSVALLADGCDLVDVDSRRPAREQIAA